MSQVEERGAHVAESQTQERGAHVLGSQTQERSAHVAQSQAHERGAHVRELLRVPEIPSRGRGRLIGVAMHLFYRHGINAVGLDWILADAGVSKTTFYKHFKSKDELVVETLAVRDAWEMGAWREAVRYLVGDAPDRQLLGLIDVLDILFNDREFLGCQFINAAAEFPNPDDAIHRAAAAHKHANWEWVRALAASAGAEDPDAFADRYTVLFEGALILRSVHDRNDAAVAVRPLIELLMRSHGLDEAPPSTGAPA